MSDSEQTPGKPLFPEEPPMTRARRLRAECEAGFHPLPKQETDYYGCAPTITTGKIVASGISQSIVPWIWRQPQSPPNLWRRFWAWALLGWHYEKIE